MTNFEKIKTMNENELAKLLFEVQFDYIAAGEIAWLGWLRWLREETEINTEEVK